MPPKHKLPGFGGTGDTAVIRAMTAVQKIIQPFSQDAQLRILNGARAWVNTASMSTTFEGNDGPQVRPPEANKRGRKPGAA